MPRPNISEQKRKQIVDAFGLCFLEKPYEMITLKEIAARAQIPSGSIYFYFSSKEDILMSHANFFWTSFETEFSEISRRISCETPTLSEFAAQLFAAQRNYLADNSSILAVRYLSIIHLYPALSDLISRNQISILHHIADRIVSCGIPVKDPLNTARILYYFVDGLSLSELTQGSDHSSSCYNSFLDMLNQHDSVKNHFE